MTVGLRLPNNQRVTYADLPYGAYFLSNNIFYTKHDNRAVQLAHAD